MEHTKTMGAISLKQVVASILNKRGDYSKHDNKRLLQFAIEGCREFRLYHIPSVESEWVDVNQDLMSVPLPDQLMQFKAVGIPINGEFWSFTEKEDGIPPQGLRKRNPEKQEGDVTPDRKVTGFTAPGGQNDYMYTHQKSHRRLILYTKEYVEKVIIVYQSTGINLKGETFIPVHAFEALRAYVEYNDIDNDDQVARSEKQRKFQQMEYHKTNMRDIENMFTPEQFLDAIYHGIGQTVKR